MSEQQKNKIAYFDQAATSYPKPDIVYDFMDRYYRKFGGGSAGRGIYKGAKSAGNLINETRGLMKNLLHCPAYDCIFTSSATEALNLILQGFSWKDGMDVYLSPFEHNSVLRVVNYLGGKYNLNIYYIPVVRENISYDLQEIREQFSKNKPDVVVITHASNVCGCIAPVCDIFKLAKKYDAFTLTDMSQTAGLIDFNVTEALADVAVFAGHKTLLGPFGVAGFVKKHEIKLKPLLYGGTGIDSSNPNMPDSGFERYEAGSRNMLAIAGLNASLHWINDIGIDNILKRENVNKEELINVLRKYDNINIIKTTEQIGVVSTIFDDYASEDIGKVLSECGIAVRSGLQCAPLAHKFLGTFPAGTVRFSVGYFTDDEDFSMLDKALKYIYDNA